MRHSVDIKSSQFQPFVGRALPWLVLAILLLYTHAKFFEHPYYGFRWNSVNGEVLAIYVPQTVIQPPLEVGDHIIQVGPLVLDDFTRDPSMPMFDDVRPGEVVPLKVEHQGEEKMIPWIFPGPNREEVLDLVFSEGWLALAFWFVGTLALFHLRPKDARWSLMIAFNYLTALWLTFGSGLSQYHIWDAALLLRVAVWFSVPVYLHLHWVFPKPLGKLPPVVVWGSYLLAAGFAGAELFGRVPKNLYSLGLVVALVGSLGLLVVHAVLQAESRRDLRLVLIASLISFVPGIVVGSIGVVGQLPAFAGGALLGLPLIPLAYLYAAYRRQLGGLELRINRLISIYLFLTLLFAGLLALIALTSIRFSLNGTVSLGTTVLIGVIFSTLAILVTILGFSSFQSFVEHRLLGIPLSSNNLREIYSARIAASDSISGLLDFLEHAILPTLLVRQFAFLQCRDNLWETLLVISVAKQQIPHGNELLEVVAESGQYRSPVTTEIQPTVSWIRLTLPLRVGEELTGVWLFGRRDPDDVYSQREIPILESLANQTAIALSNILQTERLKSMYEANIDRYEQERLRLSRDLHDSILNEMAALLIRGDAPVFSPGFQQALEALTERLREIIFDLRPPTLNFGLKYALEDLAESLSERIQSAVKIQLDIQADRDWRYPELVENHSYRIVQEACENALKYAHAKTIRIVASLFQDGFDIKVEDDGVGFNVETNLKLKDILANKHFGLAGMHERASLIGAKLNIVSKASQGAQIRVIWKAKEPI